MWNETLSLRTETLRARLDLTCQQLPAAFARSRWSCRRAARGVHGGSRMRQRPKALGFVSLLTLLVALDVATPLEAVSRSRQCRKACREQIASCVGAGGRPRACRRRVLGRC